MLYAIMRHEKLKDWGEVAAVAGHHSRSRETPNANPDVRNIWLAGSRDIVGDVRGLIGSRKLRKNAVLAIEVVMTATPGFFRPDSPERAGYYDPARLDDFQKQAMAWLKHTFGSGNIASAIVHLDESTPHIQAVVVPVDPDTDKLNASRWLDGAKKLSALQDSFAEFCRPLGLSRGIKGSKATHTRISEFYGAANMAEPPAVPVAVVQTPPMMVMEAARERWSAAESARIDAEQRPALQPVADVAATAQLAKRKQREAEATAHAAQADLERMRREAGLVRDIPLEEVLARAGYERDKYDGKKWRGVSGHITVETRHGRAKFYNHDLGIGGGGAIDLVKHVTGLDFRGAVAWLGGEVGKPEAVGAAMFHAKAEASEAVRLPVPMPEPVDAHWPRVRTYLTDIRGLSGSAIDWFHRRGTIFADAHANAVFRYGEGGVELRGTGEQRWRGFRGKKVAGFWVRRKGSGGLGVCESAIEALSYADIHDGRDAVSVGGVATEAAAAIARRAIGQGRTVWAAFNADDAGDKAAARLIEAVPGVLRDRPQGKDWNDDLLAQRSGGEKGDAGKDEDMALDAQSPGPGENNSIYGI